MNARNLWLGSMVAGLGLMLGSAWAGDGAKKAQRKAERQTFNQEQKERREGHYSEQKAENKEFRQTLKDKSAQDKASAIADHRQTQYNENASFRSEQHSKRSAFIDQLVTDGLLSADKAASVKTKLSSRWTEAEAKRQDLVGDTVNTLNDLAKNNELTNEQLKAALKQLHQSHKADWEAWRNEQKADK